MFIVDVALEHICAEFRSKAVDGQITAVERDLLIDGAVLLANKIEELDNDARIGLPPARPGPGRHATGVVSWRPRRQAQHTAVGR